jgi:hypothetical protein
VPPKVVFDCVVYLPAAAREESPAAACLRLAENNLVRDNDLLDLMKPTTPDVNFQKRFPFLRILDPVAFLKEIAQRQSERIEQ